MSASSRAVRPGSIGVMGGTFDPIHLGHLAIAAEAQAALGLARILFVPAARPPHRPVDTIAPVADRVAMVALAIDGHPGFELSDIEVRRPGPSYTSDTIAELGEAERTAGRDPDLTFILSAETLRELPTWRDPERLLDGCRVAVVPRGGYPAPDPAWLADRFPGREGRFDVLTGPARTVSSTEVRERVAAGRSIRGLVPPAVARYIGDHGLYRSPSRRPGPARRTSTR